MTEKPKNGRGGAMYDESRNISAIRDSLTAVQKNIFNHIWDYYLGSGKAAPSRSLQHTLGKPPCAAKKVVQYRHAAVLLPQGVLISVRLPTLRASQLHR